MNIFSYKRFMWISQKPHKSSTGMRFNGISNAHDENDTLPKRFLLTVYFSTLNKNQYVTRIIRKQTC